MTGAAPRFIALAFGLAACRPTAAVHLRDPSTTSECHSVPTPDDPASLTGLTTATPESEGVDPRQLLALSEWVRTHDVPIFSLLVSRHGHLVFELYTSGITRNDAHYVMSVTKSFTSALVGIAVGNGLLGGADESVADALPRALFASDAERERFRPVTLEDVMGMSALDAEVAPHQNTPDARERLRAFVTSPDRVRFALTQPLLPQLGVSFQYTDITPMLAVGAVEHAAGMRAFAYAQEHLFEPLGFRNAEWMHTDASGGDNGAYGLRMRPVDMQKFGVMYLQHGVWNGRAVLSPEWVARSFAPWIRSHPELGAPNYGRYFWTQHYGPWTAREANGWKGQRITIVPETDVVVTMTAAFEGDDDAPFRYLMEHFVVPAVGAAMEPMPEVTAALHTSVTAVREETDRRRPSLEWRMVPGVEARERRQGATTGSADDGTLPGR